nr:unnamed protein product [Spirometra erinaceieuropaei]
MICNFVVFWLPLTHALFHKDKDSRQSFDVVFTFLSNLKIFERMFSSCKEVQLFIHSFLQHSHTYSVCNNGAISVTPAPNGDGLSPLIPPHELSHRLVANVEAELSSVFKNASRGSAESIPLIEATVAVGLKVGKFLNESSEYANGYSAAHLVYKYVRTHARECAIPSTLSIRWEYEAMCIMLRSMNSHNMYLEHEHRLIFCQEAPRLLRRILQLRISANRASPRKSEISEDLLLSSLPSELLQPRRTLVRRNLEAIRLYCGAGTRANDVPFSESAENLFSSSSASSSSSIFEELFPLVLGDSSLNASTSNNCSLESLPSSGILAEVSPEDAVSDECDDSTIAVETSPSDSTAFLSTAFLHAQLAIFYYSMCNYRLAYQFTVLAMDEIGGTAPLDSSTASPRPHPSVVVEVLRIACRVCIIQRKYALGMRIIRRAIAYARKHLGRQNVTYANLLLEYGCLLLNTDKTHRAASIYRLGLAIILDCLPGASIMAALALEDIAYAYYVLEYSSGDFAYAIECADVAGTILKRLQYEVCMQAASANRVKALILEEIALDDNDPSRTKSYLYTARDLHMQSLDLCERTFGTWNIQTAKHFGNLGRLFQSMEHNKAAEEMHLKAIMIKERLLGPNDFEVGLSVGHLASLYNYHMNRYHEAELLYLRSIKISRSAYPLFPRVCHWSPQNGGECRLTKSVS